MITPTRTVFTDITPQIQDVPYQHEDVLWSILDQHKCPAGQIMIQVECPQSGAEKINDFEIFSAPAADPGTTDDACYICVIPTPSSPTPKYDYLCSSAPCGCYEDPNGGYDTLQECDAAYQSAKCGETCTSGAAGNTCCCEQCFVNVSTGESNCGSSGGDGYSACPCDCPVCEQEQPPACYTPPPPSSPSNTKTTPPSSPSLTNTTPPTSPSSTETNTTPPTSPSPTDTECYVDPDTGESNCPTSPPPTSDTPTNTNPTTPSETQTKTNATSPTIPPSSPTPTSPSDTPTSPTFDGTTPTTPPTSLTPTSPTGCKSSFTEHVINSFSNGSWAPNGFLEEEEVIHCTHYQDLESKDAEKCPCPSGCVETQEKCDEWVEGGSIEDSSFNGSVWHTFPGPYGSDCSFQIEGSTTITYKECSFDVVYKKAECCCVESGISSCTEHKCSNNNFEKGSFNIADVTMCNGKNAYGSSCKDVGEAPNDPGAPSFQTNVGPSGGGSSFPIDVSVPASQQMQPKTTQYCANKDGKVQWCFDETVFIDDLQIDCDGQEPPTFTVSGSGHTENNCETKAASQKYSYCENTSLSWWSSHCNCPNAPDCKVVPCNSLALGNRNSTCARCGTSSSPVNDPACPPANQLPSPSECQGAKDAGDWANCINACKNDWCNNHNCPPGADFTLGGSLAIPALCTNFGKDDEGVCTDCSGNPSPSGR